MKASSSHQSNGTQLTKGKFKSLTAAVLETLRHDILSTRIKPGSRLNIATLSQEYGVSPGAIREALSRLAAEQLVEFQEPRGFFVPTLSRTALLDITMTRTLVDTAALRRSMELGDARWEAAVVGSLHLLDNTPTGSPDDEAFPSQAWQSAHRAFHAALIAACESPSLLHLHDVYYNHSERYRNLSAYSRLGVNRDVPGEHRRIAEAVIARDFDGALEALETHYATTAQILITSLNL